MGARATKDYAVEADSFLSCCWVRRRLLNELVKLEKSKDHGFLLELY